MALEIITNNRPRELISWADLTRRERESFDYLDTEQKRETADFFRYRGAVYDAAEFLTAPADFGKWDGYHADSAFSGILLKYDRNGRYIVGRYYAKG